MRRRHALPYLAAAAFAAVAACVGDDSTTKDGGSDATTDGGGGDVVQTADATDAPTEAGPWTPAVLDGDGSLALWLAASPSANVVISSGQVGVWKDLSKNHNDATNGSAGPTVHGSAINGLDALSFDTLGLSLDVADAPSLQFAADQVLIMAVERATAVPFYLFSKAREKNGGGGQYFYTGIEVRAEQGATLDGGTGTVLTAELLDDPTDAGVTDGVTESWSTGVFDDGKFHIVGLRRTKATEVQLLVDDASPQTATTTAADVSSVGNDVRIGSIKYGTVTYTVHGEIAEIVVVHSTVVADSVVADVHQYLKSKYAL